MKTSTLLRFLTVFLFILLIAVFVSYRSGFFSQEKIEPSLAIFYDTVSPVKKTDTVILPDRDSVEYSLMPGSKSLIIRESPKLKKPAMSGSKHGPIFPPSGSIKPKTDTIILQKKEQ